MKTLAFLSLLSIIFAGELAAQGKLITGRVTDSSGNPVSNASVTVQGRRTGTSTNAEGTFRLNVPSDTYTLVFSSIGFASQEVAIAGRSSISVRLMVKETGLDEVVVAYGTAKRESYTGSVAQINNTGIEQRPITNAISALTGAAPGIQASAGSGQPGVAPAIRIRGFGSVNASSEPLYVVDGVAYTASIANIDPDDIQTISVLKDASASALYGSRAANGVILITTKRGKKGQSQLQINIKQGIVSRNLQEYDRVSAFDYYPLMWEAYRNSLAYAATPVPMAQASQTATNGIRNLLGYNPFNVRSNDIVRVDGKLNPAAQLLYPDDLNWEKPLERNGSRNDYSFGVNGGSEKTDYYVSIGYVNEKGFVIKSDYERFNGRVNLNTKPFTWFKTGLNLAGTIVKSNQVNVPAAGSTAIVNPFNFGRNIGPIYPVYAHDTTTGAYLLDQKGNKIYDLGNMASSGMPIRASNANPGRHIVAETEYNNNLYKTNVLSARTFGEVSFSKDVKFTSNISVDISNYLASTYDNKIVGDGAPAGRASRTNTTATSYTFNQLLTYNKSLGNHNIDILAGHENYDYTFIYSYASVTGQIVDGNTELGNFTTSSSVPNSRTDKHRIESYLSRLNYNYANKYFVSASYRRDGSSKFSKEARWGDFWSVAAAWRIDAESFMNMPWINLLKLRTSYGLVGNDVLLDTYNNEDYYPYQALYLLGYNNAAEAGFAQYSLSNQNLLWETNKQFDLGVDFSFLKNRINGSIEFFHRQSDNLLFNVPLPVSSGVLTISKNVGSMYNRGFEFQLGADIIQTKSFTWNINLNATTYKNRITKLPQPEIISDTKKLMVGHSLYDYWLRDWYGVDPQDGAALYAANVYSAGNTRISKSGDSVTTAYNNARYHYAGTAIPDMYGAITNTFTYKNFDLSFQLTYQLGGKVYDVTYANLMISGAYGRAMHTDILKRWQNPGDVTNVPRMDASAASLVNFGAQSDRWLTDASFLNFRTLNIGYNLPVSSVSKIRVQRARFYLSGENLSLSSARRGMNVNQLFTGATSNVYVPARILTAGLNITL